MNLDDFGAYVYRPGGHRRWDYLIDMIKEREYKAVCEVGVVGGVYGSNVHPGLNARMLLVHCSLDALFLVDVVSQREMWDALYGTRAVYMQIGSVAASKFIADQSLDLVFIDGDHAAVGRDIIAWFPKIRVGGVICGHDYGFWPGLKPTVDKLIPDVREIKGDLVWSREITPGLTLCGVDYGSCGEPQVRT